MRTLYNILYTTGLMVSAPFLLFGMWRRGQELDNFGQRFGKYSPNLKQALTNRHVLWAHISSAEDVPTAALVLPVLQRRLPNMKIVASARTSSAMALLRQELPAAISKIYLPLDRRSWVSRAFASTGARALVLIGGDLWPNFLWRAYERGTPILVLANGQRSSQLARSRRYGLFLRPVCQRMDGVATNSEALAKGWIDLGVPENHVHRIGDVRFDNSLEIPGDNEMPVGMDSNSPPRGARIVLCTHLLAKDITAIVRPLSKALMDLPQTVIALSPAAKQSQREFRAELRAAKIPFTTPTNESQLQTWAGKSGCVLVEPKQLGAWKSACQVLVLGGSSQPLESGLDPMAALRTGKPVVIGTSAGALSDILRTLAQRKALVHASSAAELQKTVKLLLTDPKQADALVMSARAVAEENAGAIERFVNLVIANVDEEVYVAP